MYESPGFIVFAIVWFLFLHRYQQNWGRIILKLKRHIQHRPTIKYVHPKSMDIHIDS